LDIKILILSDCYWTIWELGWKNNAGGYLTTFDRRELTGQPGYSERNHVKKWFQKVSIRIDRFHSFWLGSQPSARYWWRRFGHYHNRNRPY